MQDRGTEQEYCPFNRRGWEIDPRIETAIGYAQVLRKLQHEAKGGSHRIGVVSMPHLGHVEISATTARFRGVGMRAV